MRILFKGYLPMKDKKALEPYKDRTLFYTLEAVQDLPGYGGILDEDKVQVDLDDGEQAETLLGILDDYKIPCSVLKTTRGMHFYFINTGIARNRVKARLAIGLDADIGVGSNNRLIPLKIDGKCREWIRTTDQLAPLPLWLNPVDNVPDFASMVEGDGRNQTLYNYILTLQGNGFSKDDSRFTLTIVNKYVMKKPLAKRELETIFRDDAFVKPVFFRGSTFLHDRFAEYVCREESIVMIDGRLHVYNGQVYTPDMSRIERRMIQHLPSMTRSRRQEVMCYLELIAPECDYAPMHLIACRNGILDTSTLELMPFSPDHKVPNQIPHDWNPQATCETVDAVLDKISCGDTEVRGLLEEAPGYALLRRSEYGAAFFLTGNGKNGKSTYLDMVKGLLGRNNYAALSFKSLDDRFKTAELFGKLANIGDDIGKSFIDDNSIFKNIATGNTVNVERKGKDPFDFDPYAKLFFSANDMPRIRDTTDGLMRRLWLIPFNAVFSREDPDYDPLIKDKLLTKAGMERLLVLAVAGMRRIIANKGLTEPTAVRIARGDYEVKNNPILMFVEDHEIVNQPARETYLRYSSWCRETGVMALSSVEFGRELSRRFSIESRLVKVDGKVYRVYQQKDGNRW